MTKFKKQIELFKENNDLDEMDLAVKLFGKHHNPVNLKNKLNNLLTGRTKRVTLDQLVTFCDYLGIELNDLI